MRGSAGLLLVLLVGGGFARSDEPPPAPAVPPAYEEHLGRLSPSVLPVRAVFQVHATFGDESRDLERKVETLGVVVDAPGTLLVSNTILGGTSSPMVRALQRSVPGIELHVEITRLVVLVGESHEEREASLLVRDSVRDIAWIQVKDAAERPLPAIDLAQAAPAVLGQRLLLVTRLARGFDYVPDLVRLYVSSTFTTPRTLQGVNGDFYLRAPLGHLAFDLSGRPVGALVTQEGVVTGEDAPSVRMFLLPMDGVRASLKAALASAKPK